MSRCDQTSPRDEFRNCFIRPSLSKHGGALERTGVDMTRKLLLATAVAALMTGSALAQTINNAPQNSPAGVGNEVKQAPRTGDSAQVGGTPSANTKGLQSQ